MTREGHLTLTLTHEFVKRSAWYFWRRAGTQRGATTCGSCWAPAASRCPRGPSWATCARTGPCSSCGTGESGFFPGGAGCFPGGTGCLGAGAREGGRECIMGGCMRGCRTMIFFSSRIPICRIIRTNGRSCGRAPVAEWIAIVRRTRREGRRIVVAGGSGGGGGGGG